MTEYLCLAGPTAAGKTAAALAIADALHPLAPVEIVSVDSALVYRGMDIGTAKPTTAELAQAPHHLIDVIEPSEAYSAARFVADATRLIAEIRGRGRLPLLVGGTMLYFKALFDGLDEMPASDPHVRAELDAQAARVGWPALHARLAQVDPMTAARLAPNDSQRIQRALEVWRVTGRPISDWQAAGTGDGGRLPLRVLRIVVAPSDRAVLHARIAERFDRMLEAGFLDEVRTLRAIPRLRDHPAPLDLPAIRAVGYRQAWEYLDGRGDAAAFRERGIAATRQLAKRQLTWLRGELGARWFDPATAGDSLARAVDAFLA